MVTPTGSFPLVNNEFGEGQGHLAITLVIVNVCVAGLLPLFNWNVFATAPHERYQWMDHLFDMVHMLIKCEILIQYQHKISVYAHSVNPNVVDVEVGKPT